MELIFNNLEVVWFILITVLFAGFFLLEGFDYGTGILLPFIGKTDVERRQMINALGPVWDGNEVWMITAGGHYSHPSLTCMLHYLVDSTWLYS